MWLRAQERSPDIHQIDLDVNRTFRDHIYFYEPRNPRQRMLFQVLAAYSLYNTEVGYCQVSRQGDRPRRRLAAGEGSGSEV